jgi:hypothetical protein
MPSSASTVLRLEKMATGENSQTWGTKANVFLDILDKAHSGIAVATTGGTTTLTNVDYTADQAKAGVLDVTGTLVSNATIVIPNAAKKYSVINGTTGAFTLTIKTSGGSGIEVTQGTAVDIYCDGANVVRYVTPMVVPTTGAPQTASGATAANVAVTPTGNLSATTAQAALVELQTDIDTVNTALGNKQGLDADLTAIAALANTKGNTIVGNGAAWTAIAIGTNGKVMRANSAQASGVEWAAGAPAATSSLFQQTAAPTGWTKSDTHNNKALRLVNGSVTTGGTVAFGTAFSTSRAVSGTSGSTQLTTAQLPPHNHGYTKPSGSAGDTSTSGGGARVTGTAGDSTDNAGSGDGHTHTAGDYVVNVDVQFVDCIIAIAD